MIDIETAKQLVKKNTKPLLKETILPIEKSGGYSLCKNIYAPINMPPFRQSAMDGYALNLQDDNIYNIIGEVKAGDAHQPVLKKGEAVRIFTGAPVPDTANAVIMQEKVTITDKELVIQNSLSENHNIRAIGEQVKKGDLALEKNTKLTPAGIGYLASLGITHVSVYKKPAIGIVTTGNELIDAGEELNYGKIYESNSKMLQNALYNLKFYDITFYKVADNYKETLLELEKASKNNDLVLISGGISVGDYDFAGKALYELHVKEHFYKVMQKPGKPLFFGTKNNTLFFALPGNPAASLTCFYIYVYIALQKMMDRDKLELTKVTAKSVNGFRKFGDRPQFLKAIYKNGNVEILEGQSSAMLQTFALANAFVFLPENISNVNRNDTVETILLPNY
ncbi:molybdopterin molybdotransferase MoeA [Flavobacteriaceae bacterium XHP0103]|uniref:molybdopterin molybdotransferase MoeA n=1 Tax=Marixanthotalea marina TaxID=2844359 RepID=UPI002989B9AF|nr:molybdopterin molybdotransferase MoeA [Marixanthotalea marina]MBU3821648.1 molybdopterin molybdotransferase MoeA [Marixanthotalea marina]